MNKNYKLQNKLKLLREKKNSQKLINNAKITLAIGEGMKKYE